VDLSSFSGRLQQACVTGDGSIFLAIGGVPPIMARARYGWKLKRGTLLAARKRGAKGLLPTER